MAQSPMLTIAIKAARRAANLVSKMARELDQLPFERKAPNDFVTSADKAAEDVLIQTLLEAYPDHGVLSEERGVLGAPDAEYVWILDPIDGTTNFMHGHSQYAISIALRHKNVIKEAVVFAPVANDLFVATRGVGAFLNDRRIRVSRRQDLNECLISTGFPVTELAHLDDYLHMLKNVISKTAGVRREGAASLDLCNVAAGRVDGFWEMNLKPWDYAAASLIVQEAGGVVTDLQGNGTWWETGHILAANPKVLAQLIPLLAAK